jgi:hemerythrin-like domain-containing protein
VLGHGEGLASIPTAFQRRPALVAVPAVVEPYRRMVLASLAQLERSHRRHDEVMAELLEAARRLAAGRPDDDDLERVRAAVAFFERAATRHFVDEEGSVFPRLSTRRPELAAALAELSAEHPTQIAMQAEVAEAARGLDGEARPSAGKTLLDAAARLAEAHRAHVSREDEIFAAAHEALTAEDDDEIVAEMETRRERQDNGGLRRGRGDGGGGGGGGGSGRARTVRPEPESEAPADVEDEANEVEVDNDEAIVEQAAIDEPVLEETVIEETVIATVVFEAALDPPHARPAQRSAAAKARSSAKPRATTITARRASVAARKGGPRAKPAPAKPAKLASAKRARPAPAKRAKPAPAKPAKPAPAKRTKPAPAKRAKLAPAKRARPAPAKPARKAVKR